MSRIQSILLLSALVVAGCSSSDDSQKAPVASSPPPPAAAQTDFSNFVMTQMAAASTTETAVPVAVEAMSFSFADDNNAAAFNAAIAAAP